VAVLQLGKNLANSALFAPVDAPSRSALETGGVSFGGDLILKTPLISLDVVRACHLLNEDSSGRAANTTELQAKAGPGLHQALKQRAADFEGKPEIRTPNPKAKRHGSKIRISRFGSLSDFGLRASDLPSFGAGPSHAPHFSRASSAR
jgi:hypothetical protein